jgi:hypothetical protein
VTLALLAVGNVGAGLFTLVLALVAGVGAVAARLPGRTELRLDEQGLAVSSIVKRWSVRWLEVERFEPGTVQIGRSPSPVVCVVYRDGFERAHTPKTRLGNALGVDERYVWPGYGDLDADALAALLERFRARFGT